MPLDAVPESNPGLNMARITLLKKMDDVIGFLRTEKSWCQGQMKAQDGRRCILGAMEAVGVQGDKIIKKAILLAIRQVTGQKCRIDAFNDSYKTDYTTVVKVLHHAWKIIYDGKFQKESLLTTPSQATGWNQPLAKLREFIRA